MLDPPPPGAVQIRARFGALSRGTETLLFERTVPSEEHERMRAPFQWGSLPDPVSYGYINVGEIVAGDEARLGEPVFCLYPHHSHYNLPSTAAFALPPGIPPERCILAANAETALNAVWDADVRPGHRVQVVGAGVVGCLVARLARRIPGVEVELVDQNPSRQTIADRLELEFRAPERAGAGFDVAFECSGAPSALAPLLPRLRTEGTAVIVSWYGEHSVSLPLGSDFHSRRLHIKSSQVGRVSTMMGHLTHGDRLRLALRLLDDLALDHLITDEVKFEDLPESLPSLLNREYSGICTRIVY